MNTFNVRGQRVRQVSGMMQHKDHPEPDALPGAALPTFRILEGQISKGDPDADIDGADENTMLILEDVIQGALDDEHDPEDEDNKIFLVVRIYSLQEAMGDDAPDQWEVSVLAVSPYAAGKEKVGQAMDDYGEWYDETEGQERIDAQISGLVMYGTYATLACFTTGSMIRARGTCDECGADVIRDEDGTTWHLTEDGGNVDEEADHDVDCGWWSVTEAPAGPAIRAALDEIRAIRGLFGFYMDRAQNRIGSSGWDFIMGEL